MVYTSLAEGNKQRIRTNLHDVADAHGLVYHRILLGLIGKNDLQGTEAFLIHTGVLELSQS